MVHAYRRALVTGAPLRLVVTARVVQRALSLKGLDRLIPVYPSLKAATAAAAPATTAPVTHEPAAPHARQRRKLYRTTASGGKHEDP
jgi:hypothetical protein